MTKSNKLYRMVDFNKCYMGNRVIYGDWVVLEGKWDVY